MIKGRFVGLRAIEREDLERLKTWRNLPAFRKNFREYRELNQLHQENWFARLNSSTNDFMFLIEKLDDQTPLGACGLLYINWIIRSADFSLYIGHDESYIDNKGYALEAARLAISYGFNTLNLHKIWMELYDFDKLKIDFFTTKLNFRKDGTLRDNCFEEGQYWNSGIYSLLKTEFLMSGSKT